jgi:co-chaperonin GroES (HSP10)
MSKNQTPKKKPAIEPLHDRVLLKEIIEERGKTKSGIFIPPTSGQDKDTKKAEVIAVGPGKYEYGALVPTRVKVGDVVIYSWGEKLSFEGTEYTLARESDISAIIQN